MSEFKGTKGELYYDADKGVIKKEIGDWLAQLFHTNIINKQECKHNANLIIDAFKVRQQINCELSELLEQRNEMLEMLEKCLSEFEQCKDAIWELMEYQDGWESNKDRVEEKIEKIEQLIKQATEL